MANAAKRLETNIEGDFYVDSTCIDCATCRWMAPESFNQGGEQSRVFAQPQSDEEVQRALQALVACPTSSIGTTERHEMKSVLESFPLPVEQNVYHCGYHAESSFGATSYFIQRDDGNILIDSPRFASALVKRLEAMGGIRYMFLTHKDDVADHERFAEKFGCERILHKDDVTEGTSNVEIQLEGEEATQLTDDIQLIPVPGHTKGSVCLLYQDKYLFTGDHLFYNMQRKQLYASKRVCWYDVEHLKRSVEKLRDYSFDWVLPGHGAWIHWPQERMAEELETCIEVLK